MLRQNRGRLVKRPESGGLEVVAKGRADWVGWVELKTEPTDEQSTRNTARVIKEVDADVLGVVEAESRRSLRDFSRVMLRRVGGQPYEHSMVIDGNDDRGIDVGLMTKEGFEFDVVRTHIFELDDGQPLFSRDCVEYLVRTPPERTSSCWSTTSKANVATGRRDVANRPAASRRSSGSASRSARSSSCSAT